jgi:hypothetical protein
MTRIRTIACLDGQKVLPFFSTSLSLSAAKK